jgi:hypothetical protein
VRQGGAFEHQRRNPVRRKRGDHRLIHRQPELIDTRRGTGDSCQLLVDLLRLVLPRARLTQSPVEQRRDVMPLRGGNELAIDRLRDRRTGQDGCEPLCVFVGHARHRRLPLA